MRCRIWQEPQPTCKQATQRDLIFLSPEMLDWCSEARVDSLFADHSAAQARFQAPAFSQTQSAWVVPSVTPWGDINALGWRAAVHPSTDPQLPSTEWLQQFARGFEVSLGPFAQEPIGPGLPRACRGRAKHTRPSPAPVAKPSREGEVKLSNDLVGHEVLSWHKQLRRIQSLIHAVRAGSSSPNAQVYRASFGTKFGTAGLSKEGFTYGGQIAQFSCKEAPVPFRSVYQVQTCAEGSLKISMPTSRPLNRGTIVPEREFLIIDTRVAESSSTRSWPRVELSQLTRLSLKRCTPYWRWTRGAQKYKWMSQSMPGDIAPGHWKESRVRLSRLRASFATSPPAVLVTYIKNLPHIGFPGGRSTVRLIPDIGIAHSIFAIRFFQPASNLRSLAHSIAALQAIRRAWGGRLCPPRSSSDASVNGRRNPRSVVKDRKRSRLAGADAERHNHEFG